jgi:hypothetical protein
MLFSDPKWGNGCLALVGVVAGVTVLRAVALHFEWVTPGQRTSSPFLTLIGFLILLALVRFILNQIFD